jgi:hypothetical protein
LSQGKKILIAPLDWGLGHTTRCIPLAQTFIQAGCEVCFAGNAVQQELFREFFPHHRYFDLKVFIILNQPGHFHSRCCIRFLKFYGRYKLNEDGWKN